MEQTMTPSLDSSATRLEKAGKTARALSFSLAGYAAILGLGMVGGGQAMAAGAPVKIANFTFDPGTVTVKVGTTVTWVNDDDIPHLVVAVDGKFRSSALDTDNKFSQTFSTPGTFQYFCALHPRMTGKIIVIP
jgi:plastocyanin